MFISTMPDLVIAFPGGNGTDGRLNERLARADDLLPYDGH